MLRVQGPTRVTDGYVELDFRRPGGWPAQFGDMALTVVDLGEEERGPQIALTALSPGLSSPGAEAHAHASDNFRVSVLGSLEMGRERYGPGEFRFQHGWKAYPSDNASHGPDGGWEILVMADRRGTRGRPVGPGAPDIEAKNAYAAQILEVVAGDMVSDDPADSSGPSALASTLGPAANSGKLNGSFAEHDTWPTLDAATTATVTLMGDPSCGPVVVLAATQPHAVATSGLRVDTELYRAVVAGSFELDGRSYERGTMRIDRAGTSTGPAVAGADGLQQLLVIGDRRGLTATAGDGCEWWRALRDLVAPLQAELDSRSVVDGAVAAPARSR
jgi:hypothetical protein